MYHLLIAEDESFVRRGIRSLVDYESLQISRIFEAEDGQAAWEIFQQEEIHIVLTDINMPVLDGITLSTLIKETRPETHIIFLTGYNEFDYAVSALKMGADDYLLKPASREDIEAILQKVIDKLALMKKQEHIQTLLSEASTSDIKEAIQAQLPDPDFSLKSLADELGFSPSHLSKRIKDELGQPFQNYLIAERIRQAKLLLLTTSMKNYEIAESVGFRDINYFSHRFKLETGLTPKQFRQGGQA